MAVLFEHLSEECPEFFDLAIPSLAARLHSYPDWIRGEAVTLLGITGTAEAMTLVQSMTGDPSPQIVEIARDILNDAKGNE